MVSTMDINNKVEGFIVNQLKLDLRVRGSMAINMC